MEIHKDSLVTFIKDDKMQGGVVIEVEGTNLEVQTVEGLVQKLPVSECTVFKVRTKRGSTSHYALSRLKSFISQSNKEKQDPDDFCVRYEELKAQNIKLKRVLSTYTDIIVNKLIDPKDNSEVIASLTELVNELIQND